MKKYRLTESGLRGMIREAVNGALNEIKNFDPKNYPEWYKDIDDEFDNTNSFETEKALSKNANIMVEHLSRKLSEVLGLLQEFLHSSYGYYKHQYRWSEDEIESLRQIYRILGDNFQAFFSDPSRA